jgi:hypothetical protein
MMYCASFERGNVCTSSKRSHHTVDRSIYGKFDFPIAASWCSTAHSMWRERISTTVSTSKHVYVHRISVSNIATYTSFQIKQRGKYYSHVHQHFNAKRVVSVTNSISVLLESPLSFFNCHRLTLCE